MFAEPLSVCAARFALRSSSDLRGVGDPALQRLRDFGRLRRRVVQEGVEQRGVDVARNVESEVGRFERFGRGLFGFIERRADAVRGRQFRAQFGQRRFVERQRHPAAAEMRDQRVDGRCARGVAQVRLEQLRPVGEERPHQHARVLVVGVEVFEIVEHAGADALHAGEAHVARGFRKPRDGRYIGIVGRRARRIVRGSRVVRRRELGCETLELVGERCEEVLSSHRCVPAFR